MSDLTEIEICSKQYRKVYVKIIHWEIDGFDAEVANLERVFRDVYGYTTERMTLFTPGEGRGTHGSENLQPGTYHQGDYMHADDGWMYSNAFLDEMFGMDCPSDGWAMDDVLHVTCYLGGTVCEVGGNPMREWMYLSAVPCVPIRVRQQYISSGDANWIGTATSFPELYVDTLFILDCNLGIDSEPETLIRAGYDQCFEIIAAKYHNPDKRPGRLLGHLAMVLEAAVDANESLRREVLLTTMALGKRLSKVLGEDGELIWAPSFGARCPYMIALDRVNSPIFRMGGYHQLSEYNSHRAYEQKEMLYENGMTQVIKASIPAGVHRFSKSGSAFVCAIKRFTPRARNQGIALKRSFEEEVEMLKHISTWKHKHILNFLAAFYVPSDGHYGSFAIILPYADEGSLYDFLRLPVTPEWLQSAEEHFKVHRWDVVCAQVLGIVDALALVHSKSPGSKFMIHRDIKPANILIRRGVFKLADFGAARFKEAEETSKTTWDLGTPMYEPPERALQQDCTFGRARDVWALGCVFLEILALLCYDFRGSPAAVEEFELARFKASGERETRKFALTLDCVSEWMDRLKLEANSFHPHSTRKKLEILLETSREMLASDPGTRISSAFVRDKLQGMYLDRSHSKALSYARQSIEVPQKRQHSKVAAEASMDTESDFEMPARRPRTSHYGNNIFNPLPTYFTLTTSGELIRKERGLGRALGRSREED